MVAALLVAILILFIYQYAAEKLYFDAVRDAMRRNLGIPAAEQIAPFQGDTTVMLEIDATTEPKPLKIEGDAVIVVDEPKEFKASDDEGPVVVTWSVDPSDGATLEAGGSTTELQGASVKLTASKKGTLKLTASAEGHTPATVPLAAIVAPAETPRLPFIGSGYGTIIIVFFILTVVGVLSVLGELNSAAATILGALAGYVFSREAQSARGGAGSTASGSGTQSGTDGAPSPGTTSGPGS